MLAEAFAEIRGMQPGEIQIEYLPDLRNIVVVDNKEEAKADLAKLHIKSMVDWREILLWREDAREGRVQRDISASLDKDDVINIQFTRCVWRFTQIFILTNQAISYSVERLGPQKECRCVQMMLAVDAS